MNSVYIYVRFYFEYIYDTPNFDSFSVFNFLQVISVFLLGLKTLLWPYAQWFLCSNVTSHLSPRFCVTATEILS